MCPRPRTVTDEAIFAATARMMGELGPTQLTLARVAREAGLAPATLVQRFGSKRALFLALAKSGVQADPAEIASKLRLRHPSPLAALRAFLTGFAAMASSPSEYANHLAFLQIDLTDTEFLRITQKIVAAHDRAAEQLVAEAMAAGELEPGEPKAIMHLLQSVVTGSLMRWAIYRRGPARTWLTRDLDTALARLGRVVSLLALSAALWLGTACARDTDPRGVNPTDAADRFFACRGCNVLLVSLDTLRADRLGAYGYGRGTSPDLDRFAARSVVFRDVLAQAPSTTPSHRSMFTGLYVSQHRNQQGPPTMAELLRGAGYRTAAFVDGGRMSRPFGLDGGFETWEESGLGRVVAKAAPTGGLDDLLPKALDWLGRHRRQSRQPFFLFLHSYEVHCPYTPPEPHRTHFTGGHRPDFDPSAHCGPDFDRLKLDPTEMEFISDLYDAEVRHLDSQLGSLFAAIERLKLHDDTLVIVTADHGESLGERRRIGHNQVYDVQLKVPLLIRLPAARHVEVRAQVQSIDILPTLLSLVGVETDSRFSGIDLAPLVYGRELGRRFRMSESWRLTERSLRDDARWTLVLRRKQAPALYDLQSDPQELDDVSARYPERVRELEAQFASHGFDARPHRQRMPDLPAETRRQLRALGYLGN